MVTYWCQKQTSFLASALSSTKTRWISAVSFTHSTHERRDVTQPVLSDWGTDCQESLSTNQARISSTGKFRDNVPPLGSILIMVRTRIPYNYWITCIARANQHYSQNTSVLSRNWVFCQRKQNNDGLPPTSDSLQLHIGSANYQEVIWKRHLRVSSTTADGGKWVEEGRRPWKRMYITSVDWR